MAPIWIVERGEDQIIKPHRTHLGSVDGLRHHQHAGPSRGRWEGGEVGRVVGGRRGRAGRLRSLAGSHLVVKAGHEVVVVQPARAFRPCNTVRQSEMGDCEIVRDNLGQTYWSDSTQSLQATVGHYRPAWYYQEIGSNPSYSRPPFAPFPVLHSIVTPGLMFKFRFLPSLILFLLFSDSKMLLDNCRCQAGGQGGRQCQFVVSDYRRIKWLPNWTGETFALTPVLCTPPMKIYEIMGS